jgi:GT2 family glycosyltransferase
MVSVITPSYQRFSALLACVESVQAAQIPDGGIEVIVVTSGYSDLELEELRKRGCTIIDLSTPASTSESRNLGAKSSSGEYLLFLDDDNVVAPNSIWLLWHSLAAWPDAALVGPAMYYGAAPNRLWCAGVSRSRVLMKTTFRRDLPEVLPERMPSDGLPNCFMVRRSDFEAVNGFDADHFPQHFEETDLARRLVDSSSGHVFVVPSAHIWHHIDMQLAQRLHMRNADRAYFCARSRAMFTALYGDRLQWIAYLLAAQWMFATLYVGAAMWLPSNQRIHVIRGYLRGQWAGLIDGWHARVENRIVTRRKLANARVGDFR